MLDARRTKTPRTGPKVFVSDSFMLAAQAGCDAADRLRGGVEVAWSAYGQWTIAKSFQGGSYIGERLQPQIFFQQTTLHLRRRLQTQRLAGVF